VWRRGAEPLGPAGVNGQRATDAGDATVEGLIRVVVTIYRDCSDEDGNHR